MQTRAATAAQPAGAVRGAAFGAAPCQLQAGDYGPPLPEEDDYFPGLAGVRQRVLMATLAKFEEASPTARYHQLAQANVQRWASEAGAPAAATAGMCRVEVLPGDWGQVTLNLTKRYGVTFASLNMANAYGPGGGYTLGMIAQEENMYRRTDCHFSLDRADMDGERYTAAKSALLNAEHGCVYLDTTHPRVCIRGPEEHGRADLGYAWLADKDVFPFYELRSAALDLRMGRRFDEGDTAKRVGAQLDTLIKHGVRHAVLSAFGCGAFLNPAPKVAAVYHRELRRRAASFDVVAFAIFKAGYGPDNFTPFATAFARWGSSEEEPAPASTFAMPPR